MDISRSVCHFTIFVLRVVTPDAIDTDDFETVERGGATMVVDHWMVLSQSDRLVSVGTWINAKILM